MNKSSSNISFNNRGRLRRPRVALNCILYNSARWVERMLLSARPVVSEIVAVVDPRTTDDTALIVKRFGGKVIYAPFRDSFSELRNICIRESTAEWILALDDDEYLSPKLRDAIPRLVMAHGVDGYRIPRRNLHKPECYPDYQLRLFRRHGRWIYRVHETVVGLNNVVCLPPGEGLDIIHDMRPKLALGLKDYSLYVRLWEMDRRDGLMKEPYPR